MSASHDAVSSQVSCNPTHPKTKTRYRQRLLYRSGSVTVSFNPGCRRVASCLGSAFRSAGCVERWLETVAPLRRVALYSGVAKINQWKQSLAIGHCSAHPGSEGV